MLQLDQMIVDILWGQPIKLIQVASNSELLENQRNDLVFFKIIPVFWMLKSTVVMTYFMFVLLRPRSNEREQFQRKEGRSIDFHAILN